MSFQRRLLRQLFEAGWLARLRRVWGSACLTVLAYHRVARLDGDFATFRPNVSASPEQFEAHLAFLQQHFTLISLAQLLAWYRGEVNLPPYPALLTFDDGYGDNFSLLSGRNIPAIIFLATAHIGQTVPFFWDLVAYCFHHTPVQEASLAGIGRRAWQSEADKQRVMVVLVNFLKRQPAANQTSLCQQLAQQLAVTVDPQAFAGLYLGWEQVQRLSQQGIAFGSHTHTHPILSQVSLAQAEQEICQSKAMIEREIGQKVIAFAYPNGQKEDLNRAIEQLVGRAGLDLAFTLWPGPAGLNELRRRPLAIRRVAISGRDDLPRFAAKLFGLTRLVGGPRG